MKVIWTPQAASDLKVAVDYISEDTPDGAAHVADRIYARVMALESTPHIGWFGMVAATRDLVFPPLEWMVVDKVDEKAVKIVGVRHTSSRRP